MADLRPLTTHYCNHCQMSTRHEDGGRTCVCLRCGVVKTSTRFMPRTTTVRDSIQADRGVAFR